MRIKGTQRPRWSIIAKLCWSRVLSDDPAWVVFFEDTGTCSHGVACFQMILHELFFCGRCWNMFSWVAFHVAAKDRLFEWAPSICAFTTLPYPLVLGEQECFAECYSVSTRSCVQSLSILVLHALWKLYLTGGRSSRSIGGGMPGAGGPGGRNVFSIGKAFVGEVTDDNSQINCTWVRCKLWACWCHCISGFVRWMCSGPGVNLRFQSLMLKCPVPRRFHPERRQRPAANQKWQLPPLAVLRVETGKLKEHLLHFFLEERVGTHRYVHWSAATCTFRVEKLASFNIQ